MMYTAMRRHQLQLASDFASLVWLKEGTKNTLACQRFFPDFYQPTKKIFHDIDYELIVSKAFYEKCNTVNSHCY